jgi:hypothetical protein
VQKLKCILSRDEDVKRSKNYFTEAREENSFSQYLMKGGLNTSPSKDIVSSVTEWKKETGENCFLDKTLYDCSVANS